MALRALAASSRRRNRLSVRQAIVLGLIQGPAEALPLSSSGHLVLIPALLGWPYARLPADTRKTFEVALHFGAGVALAWLLREDVVAAVRDPVGTAKLTVPAAATALALEDKIERHASNPVIAAAAMAAGGIGLLAAESAKPKGDCPRHRAVTQAEVKGDCPRHRAVTQAEVKGDCPLYVGLAQAAALVPGVSRNGATITAARALGLGPEAAARISWRAGLPIIGGATLLKLVRLFQRGLEPSLRVPFAAGAVAAFVSTLASAPLLRVRRHRLAGLYRVVLGAVALRRLHRLQWPRG
jgi:undecaprenyl-diphosphatase